MPHVKENLGGNAEIKFHSCPKPAWYKKWSKLLNLKGFECKKSTVVCSNHFEFGQPRLNSRHPSKFLKGYVTDIKTRKLPAKRQVEKTYLHVPVQVPVDIPVAPENVEVPVDIPVESNINTNASTCENERYNFEIEIIKLKEELKSCKDKYENIIKEKDAEIEQLKSKISFGIQGIKNDDLVKVFTGLPTYDHFCWVFDEVKESATTMSYYRGETSNDDKPYQINNTSKPGPKRKLDLRDELLITLIKLRHNVNIDFIAALFNVSTSLISVTVTTWVSLLALELKPLIYWPPRDELKRWYPDCFKRYGNEICAIIDASEVQTERPSMANINSILYSNYKQRHTFKVLVACTPGGNISYISDAAGGDMSDVELVRRSGILDNLHKGDKVMADKGFTNTDDFLLKEVELIIPQFKRKDTQFSLSQNIYNADVSNARIHVERVIGRWKNFKITKGPIPLNMIDMVDRIFTVVAALVNTMGILVPIS